MGGLFILFWAAQIYFSSFWMTILCCLKFGLMAQLLTDYMYRRGRYETGQNEKNQLNTLVGMARTEAELVPSLTAMAKEEAGMDMETKFKERAVLLERHDGYRVSDL